MEDMKEERGRKRGEKEKGPRSYALESGKENQRSIRKDRERIF